MITNVALRVLAEDKLLFNCKTTPPPEIFSYSGMLRIFHELQVHQIELEMQNEELRNIESKLITSQSAYNELYEFAPVGYITLSGDGRISNINLTATEILGDKKHYFVNKAMIRVIHVDDQNRFSQLIDVSFNKDEIRDIELRLLCCDGSYFWAHLQVVLRCNDEYWITFSDISDRKHSEEELLIRDHDLEEAQLLAKTGSWAYDPVIQKFTWSKGMFHIWGIDPSLGLFPVEGYHKYIHKDDYPKFVAVLKDAIEIGTPYDLELRINRPDGKQITIITSCQPECNDLGKVVKLRGTHQDVTDLNKAEQLAKDSMNYIKTIISASPVGIITYKATGEAISANETAAIITGTTVENLEQQNFRQLESWKRCGMLEIAERALMTGVNQSYDIEGEASSGKQVSITGIFTPFTFGFIRRICG